MNAGPPGTGRRRTELWALVALLAALAVTAAAVLTLRSGLVAESAPMRVAPTTAAPETPEPEGDDDPSSLSEPTTRPESADPVGPAHNPTDLASYHQDREAAQAAAPVRVVIDSVELDAPVEPVGVRDDGQMEVPKDVATAGWYRHGAAPGRSGSAVLAGHVDDALGRAGALAALAETEIGDEVLVEHADGTQTTYRVDRIETAPKEELAVERLFRRDGEPLLVLVTCTGPWSLATGHYVQNLVVSATPSES